MPKVTNKSNMALYVGKTEIKPHETADIPDKQLVEAKKNKVVLSWFAADKLALGEDAAEQEAEGKDKPHDEGTPAGTIRPAITTGNVLRGAARGILGKFKR